MLSKDFKSLFDSIIKQVEKGEKITIEDNYDDTVKGFIQSLNDTLSSEYKTNNYIEEQIDEFNDTLLRFAHHNYRSEIQITEEDDVLNSLATSINLLGEELNYSTITRNFLEDIFNSMTDMLIVVDAIGYINSVNNATLLGLNYSREDLERANIKIVLPTNSSYRNFLVEASKKGSATLITSTGETLPVSINISPFVRGDDLQIGNIIIARDISPMLKYQKEIVEQNALISKKNEELNHAIKKIEESEKLKTAFLQNVSHEIRTPLNSIIGLTHLINHEQLEESEKQEFSELIEKSGKRLIEIVNNILDISKIETGQYQVSNRFFSLNELMKDLQHLFAKEAEKKKVELSHHCDFSSEEDVIYSDRYVINQALTNLINNALKFTHKGSVKFGYNLVHDHLKFYVIDTGIGINKEHQKLIFDRFSQVDSSLSRNHEGAGLGLSITKGTIELLGGRIWLESEVNKGSAFRFTVPYKGQQNKTGKEKKIDHIKLNKELGNLKILVAEDDEVNFKYINHVLSTGGHKVTRASNGIEAIQRLEENEIDLILMDIKMPKMDGIQATRIIRESHLDIPIIALTAFAFNEEKSKLLTHGFDDYLTKPLKVSNLYVSIHKCLTKKQTGK